MSGNIKIDIVSDVVCPWCVIGYKRLERAISDLKLEEKIQIQWKPFELNPNISKDGENITKHLNRKYGMSVDDVENFQSNMTKMGKEEGFKFDHFTEMKIVNTRDAHILLDFAKEYGKQTELKMRLFESFFTERKDVSNRIILLDAIKEIGLDEEKALLILENDANLEIQKEEEYWKSLGITGVPTIMFNDAVTLNGAQSIDTYKKILENLTS
jgi:predicted DsbA family dithiol-disulfide isomerase